MSWVLIITVIGLSHYNPAVTAVGGFTSEAACVSAGNSYLRSVKGIALIEASALCVRS